MNHERTGAGATSRRRGLAAVIVLGALLPGGGGGADDARPARAADPGRGPGPGDGGPATAATLDFPLGLAIGAGGSIYVSERRGHRVRRVDAATGVITTYAGTGEPGFSGDGGPATAAKLHCPDSIDLDARGNLYVADRCNERIRRVDAATGVITTVAGNGERARSADGPALTRSLGGPFYVRVESTETLLFTDTDVNLVRRVDLAAGRIVTLAGNGERAFSGDGGPALAASLARPHVALTARDGDLVIGDSFNQRIRRVDHATGIIRTVAGKGETGEAADGTPALEAPFGFFGQIHELPGGELIFSEWIHGRLLRLDHGPGGTGVLRVLAGTTDPAAPTGDGHPPRATRFGPLADFDYDARGRVVVVAAETGQVRRIDLERGVVETLAGRPAAGG